MDLLSFDQLLLQFVTIFVVIDPIGTLPVFYFATAHVPTRLHRRIALRAVAIAFAVLMLFLVFGQLLLEGLGLRFGSFQIAGGIVLFLFALSMIFGPSKPEQEIAVAEQEADLSSAAFPLAMPSIASPGAMLAIVVLTENSAHSIPDQAVTAGLLALVMLVVLVVLLAAVPLKRIIGASGASVISRVMGIILATVAVDAILGGLDAVGALNLTRQPEAFGIL
ncbi:MAG: MarC family protein [Mangrovicoccus sp.]